MADVTNLRIQTDYHAGYPTNDELIYDNISVSTQIATAVDNDTLLGGAGEDLIYGGAGDDSIEGGTDNDTIYGEDGNDTIRADEGDDEV